MWGCSGGGGGDRVLVMGVALVVTAFVWVAVVIVLEVF